MTKQNQMKNIIVFGFTLFATFFGAGNLIFPPYLGIVSGPQWLLSFLGFTIADAGLALLAVLAIARYKGDIYALFNRAGNKLALILSILVIMCIGPLIVIPRTAATTYEMGLIPTLGPVIPRAVFAALFFALVYVLTIKPSKVVDIVGSVLTPVLLIALTIIIIKGVATPIGKVIDKPMIDQVFARGIKDGYQTMDCFVPLAIGSVLIATLKDKGYTKINEQVKILSKAGIVAAIGLCLVYGGLCYLGATVSTKYGIDAVQSQVIVNITNTLLGTVGRVVLATVVSLACLTTAIGLTSGTAKVFNKLSNGKLSYEIIVLGACVFSAALASMDVSKIVAFAGPILAIVYPPTIVLIVLSFFKDKISNLNIYRFATYSALAISITTVAADYAPQLGFIHSLPLDSLGFNWIIPVILFGIVGSFIPSRESIAQEEVLVEEN